MTARQPWLGIKTRDWFINSDTPQCEQRWTSCSQRTIPTPRSR